MALTNQQKAFYRENDYLKYDKRILSDAEVNALRQRTEDIVNGHLSHIPPRFIQLEAKFRGNTDPTVDPLDTVRKMTQLCYFDDLFATVPQKSAIVDVVEDLVGPNIKLYTDQLMMKPRFNGTVTDWHQDSVAWSHFAPQEHVSCWLALDDATVDNGCMTVVPGSHHWGPIARQNQNAFLDNPLVSAPVPVEIKAGYCMFHHGLNFHRTGANSTPSRRRGLAMHFIRSETMYLGIEDEEARLLTECEKPRGEFRFMLIRGQEFPGRV
jgi:phytanoyl-CoA hydroxylase